MVLAGTSTRAQVNATGETTPTGESGPTRGASMTGEHSTVDVETEPAWMQRSHETSSTDRASRGQNTCKDRLRDPSGAIVSRVRTGRGTPITARPPTRRFEADREMRRCDPCRRSARKRRTMLPPAAKAARARESGGDAACTVCVDAQMRGRRRRRPSAPAAGNTRAREHLRGDGAVVSGVEAGPLSCAEVDRPSLGLSVSVAFRQPMAAKICAPPRNRRQLSLAKLAARFIRAYDFCMHKARVTVTVRREVLAKAERQVRRGRAKSVSAWVDAAMEEKARREDLAALLSEMKADDGPATAEEQAWARDVLGL